MDNMITIEVTSAFLAGGEVAMPGSQVLLPRAEALALVARGKAELTESVEANEAAPEPEDATEAALDEERPARARRGKG